MTPTRESLDPGLPSEEQAARMWSRISQGTKTGKRSYPWVIERDHNWRDGFDRGRRSGLRLGFLLGIALGVAVLLAWTWFR